MAHGFRKNKAQSVLEYAAVISCLVAALLAMGVYIKRAYEGRLKQNADQFGAQYAVRKTTGSGVTNYISDSVSQTKIVDEVDLGYDLDGDGELEHDSTATYSINALGVYDETTPPDDIVDPWDLTGGTISREVSNYTVGEIKDEELFDE